MAERPCVFVSPHDDDQVLFGAFTLLKHKPIVVVVFDSHVQPRRGLCGCSMMHRAAESKTACGVLGCRDVRRLRFRDDEGVSSQAIRDALRESVRGPLDDFHWFLPAWEQGAHVQHNQVAGVFAGQIPATRYLTYTDQGKSTNGAEVPIESPDWIMAKLLALACFTSQFNLDPRMGCWPHFLRSQLEYYAQ